MDANGRVVWQPWKNPLKSWWTQLNTFSPFTRMFLEQVELWLPISNILFCSLGHTGMESIIQTFVWCTQDRAVLACLPEPQRTLPPQCPTRAGASILDPQVAMAVRRDALERRTWKQSDRETSEEPRGNTHCYGQKVSHTSTYVGTSLLRWWYLHVGSLGGA